MLYFSYRQGNVETSLYNNVSTFEDILSYLSAWQKMWKHVHVYIAMFQHVKIYYFLQISSIDGGGIHGMSIIIHNKVGPSCPGSLNSDFL